MKLEMKEEYLLYLDDLRISGINMYGARPHLMRVFIELDKNEAGEVLKYWMRTFDERNKVEA